MPTGGEADKLGNRYEGIWTVFQLLSLLQNAVSQITCEPLSDPTGIEFTTIDEAGIKHHHSVKSETTESNWTIPLLARAGDNSRSILGDLLAKLKAEPTCHVTFVSQVSANDLRFITEAAHNCDDLGSMIDRLNSDRRNFFRERIASQCGSETEAFGLLKRLHVETNLQPRLIEMVEERIRYVLRRHTGTLDPLAARLYLAEYIVERLTHLISRQNLVEKLNAGGYLEADWAHEQTIRGLIQGRNDSYLRSVKIALINNRLIQREEAQTAFNHVSNGGSKYGIFVGTAGRGKSCVIAGLLDSLSANAIPYVALRLDTPYDAKTPTTLGLEMGFPMSPVTLLAATSDGGKSVLLLDQLDALSLISGRKTMTWDLFSDLLAEAERYPNMQIWLACRDFDLENDFRLRDLVKRHNAQSIPVGLLSEAVVRAQINMTPGLSADHLTPRQIEMLRTPMHLSLYLDGDPANRPPFATVQDLYDRYWDRKKLRVKELLSRDSKWDAVIDDLCDELSANQTLTAPRRPLDDNYGDDVTAMASENVIVLDLGRYRFFHEGFFDYAFARRFARRNRKLVDLLLRDGEQHLFRRAQVRQILTYLRDQDDGRKRYYEELNSLMTTDGIRPHIIKLVLDWLSSLPDPVPEESDIINLV
jgi:hypothetical protein